MASRPRTTRERTYRTMYVADVGVVGRVVKTEVRADGRVVATLDGDAKCVVVRDGHVERGTHGRLSLHGRRVEWRDTCE